MKIIIQAFEDENEANRVEYYGDCVATADSFTEAIQHLEMMEKNGI